MKLKNLRKTEIYMIIFTVVMILTILATWKNFKQRVSLGLENYKAVFEQVDTLDLE